MKRGKMFRTSFEWPGGLVHAAAVFMCFSPYFKFSTENTSLFTSA